MLKKIIISILIFIAVIGTVGFLGTTTEGRLPLQHSNFFLHMQSGYSEAKTSNENYTLLITQTDSRRGTLITFKIVDNQSGATVFYPKRSWKADNVKKIAFNNKSNDVVVITCDKGVIFYRQNENGNWSTWHKK